MGQAGSVLKNRLAIFPDENHTAEFAIGRSVIEPPRERFDLHHRSLESR
jgi:hypothetical protein